MAVSYMDFTAPTTQFTYTLSDNPFFKKDNRNYINALSINQLNTLGNVSLLDIFLSRQNVVEPHIHQNASELVYCISGAATVSVLNPFSKELLDFPIQPGQVANVPQGWWHYEVATEDNTHLLAIFDAPVPEFIPGSDLLRLTPAKLLAHTYCLNEELVQQAFAPITDTVVIGPPADCSSSSSEAHWITAQQGQSHVVSTNLYSPAQQNLYYSNYGGTPQSATGQQMTGFSFPGLHPSAPSSYGVYSAAPMNTMNVMNSPQTANSASVPVMPPAFPQGYPSLPMMTANTHPTALNTDKANVSKDKSAAAKIYSTAQNLLISNHGR